MKILFLVLIVLLIAVSTGNILWKSGTDIPQGSWPSQDVVYDPTNQLWACCFNPTENIVDCTDPGNETFEAPAPSSLVVFAGATASATVGAVVPAPISTVSSPTPTRPIQSSTSLQSTSSSSRPEASSSSIVPESCKCPSQQGIDIGFGIGIGALGSVIIAVAIAYRVSDWRVYRRAYPRPDWRETEPWERHGPRDKGPWDRDRHGIRIEEMPTRITARYPFHRVRRAVSPTILQRRHPTMSYERISRPSRRRGERIIIAGSPIYRSEEELRPARFERHHPTMSYERIHTPSSRQGEEIIVSASPMNRSEEELRPARYERIHRPLRTQRETIIVSASRNNGREDADRPDRPDRESRVQHMRERERSAEPRVPDMRERERSARRERDRSEGREREWYEGRERERSAG